MYFSLFAVFLTFTKELIVKNSLCFPVLIKYLIYSLEQQILAEYEAGVNHEHAAIQSSIQTHYDYEVICPVCQRYAY